MTPNKPHLLFYSLTLGLSALGFADPVMPSPEQGSVSEEGRFVPSEKANQFTKPPQIEQLKNGQFQVGGVTIDQELWKLSFAAEVAATDAPLEYLLVHETGKTHEALFATKVDGRSLHIAALLLGADGQAPKLEVTWQKNGPDARFALKELVEFSDEAPKLAQSQWVYTGSTFYRSGFAAQQSGSLVALMFDPDALINWEASREAKRDDLFAAKAALLPQKGIPVTIEITFPNSKP